MPDLLSGAQALSLGDAAVQLSAALGRTIRYVDVPVEDALDSLRTQGVPGWQIAQMLGYAQALAAGEVADVADTVARPPRAFADFAGDLLAAAA